MQCGVAVKVLSLQWKVSSFMEVVGRGGCSGNMWEPIEGIYPVVADSRTACAQGKPNS